MKMSPVACSEKPRRRMSSSPPSAARKVMPRGVLQRFLQRVEVAVVHQLLGDHGDRLRNVAQFLLALADGGGGGPQALLAAVLDFSGDLDGRHGLLRRRRSGSGTILCQGRDRPGKNQESEGKTNVATQKIRHGNP